MRYEFNLDPNSKEVATVEEIPEFHDDIPELEYLDFGRDFRQVFEESDDMIGPAGALNFNDRPDLGDFED